MKRNLVIASLLLITCVHTLTFAQSLGDYLLLQDIGLYKLDKLEKHLPGEPPSGGPRSYNSAGVVAGADHFSLDHTDKTYEVMYLGGDASSSPTIQVTQHTGGDSDKWLLHELEDGYRDDDNLNETVDTGVQMRMIGSNNVYFIAIYGAKSYAWISNNYIVVKIGCPNCPNSKPEPLDVINAYLTKFPSIITLTDSDLRSQAHSVQWIKDEMDRRLWLCDKWFGQLSAGNTDQRTALSGAVKSMNVFLDYREKYYGVAGGAEKNFLASYLATNDITNIQSKLQTYKDWWTANKGGHRVSPFGA